MSSRRALLVFYAITLSMTTANVQAATPRDTTASDAMPAAPIPIVPLPPALVGAGASIGIAALLRFSRHRRWITLR